MSHLCKRCDTYGTPNAVKQFKSILCHHYRSSNNNDNNNINSYGPLTPYPKVFLTNISSTNYECQRAHQLSCLANIFVSSY